MRWGWTRRVITGTDSRVKTSAVSPQVAAHVTLLPVLASSSWAMAMRSARVSSRNRRIHAGLPLGRAGRRCLDRAVDGDLLPVPHHREGREPLVGKPPLEPAVDTLFIGCCWHVMM